MSALIQMSELKPLLLALAVAWLVVLVGRNFLRARSRNRFAAARGCKEPARYPQPETILGFHFLRGQLAAARSHGLLAGFQRRHDDFGNTFSVAVAGRRFICTIEPDNVRAVLSTNFHDYSVAHSRDKPFGPLIGHGGVFTSDGATWEHARAMLRPSFSRDRISDLPALENHVKHLFDRLPKDGVAVVDLQPLFLGLTLDSSTEFLFGESVESLLRQSATEGQRFAEAFEYAQAEMVKRYRLGPLLPFYFNPRFKKSCKIARGFVEKLVQNALDRQRQTSDHVVSKQRYVFIDALAAETQDPEQLRTAALNILLAGRDTTASLLGNAFYSISQRPDVWTKIRKEVSQLNGEYPSYETLRNLKYIRYTLNETLRLFPSIPANSRFAIKDTVLPTGGGPDGRSPIFLAKGDGVSYVVNSMHRRKDIFGPDAEDFSPERWETLRTTWAYLPFNGGPRVCLGQQYAMTEAMYTIARMAQVFDDIRYHGEPYKEKLSLSLTNFNGVKVTLRSSGGDLT